MESPVRITDIAQSTPVVGARPAPPRRSGAGAAAAPLLPSDRSMRAAHPDEVAASKLARAAGVATATRVVAAANEQASESVRGERLDLARVP